MSGHRPNMGESPVKYAAFEESTAAGHTLVAAVASKKIRVIALALWSAGQSTVELHDSTPADMMGIGTVILGNPLVLPLNEWGWFETGVAATLRMTLGSAVAVGGVVVYVEV